MKKNSIFLLPNLSLLTKYLVIHYFTSCSVNHSISNSFVIHMHFRFFYHDLTF